MKKLLLVAVLAMVGAITGCGDSALPYLVSIQVSPATPTVAAGLPQQFAAQGTFSNGTMRDLTTLVTWSSSTAYVATIASSGLATTFSQGTSTITASFNVPSGTITGTETLTVGAPALVSVVLSDSTVVVPGPNSVDNVRIFPGVGHQFIAYGIYSDGGERNITTSVTWSSSNVKVATINNAGVATPGIIGGATTITATDPTTSLAKSATLSFLNATPFAIAVSPVNQTIAPLTKVSFLALGVMTDGSRPFITEDVNWGSTNTGAATVTNSTPNGVVTGVAAGSTMIQATLRGTTKSAPLTVSSASPVSIALTPSTSGVAIGSTLLVQAVATFSDGTTQPINQVATWSVSPNDGSVATVNQAGLVTGVAAGAATVTAEFGGVSATAALTVENVSSIAITPTTAAIAEGTATPFKAIATLADSTKQDVTSSVTWISATPSTAIISDAPGSAGWATGIAAGTDMIGAVLGGQYAWVQLTVTNATLSTIAITPATQSIALGSTQQYTATGTFSDSTTQDLTDQVTWVTSNPETAVIIRTGLASGLRVGSTHVVAEANINGIMATDTKIIVVF